MHIEQANGIIYFFYLLRSKKFDRDPQRSDNHIPENNHTEVLQQKLYNLTQLYHEWPFI
jgi:hypothetical protein